VTTSAFPIEELPPPPRRFPVRRTVAALCVLALVVLPGAWWHLTPPRAVGVVVVDKTLPRPVWREHERVHWWLEYRRVLGPRGDVSWRDATDYVGYDPVTQRGTDLDSTHLATARLLYIADAYGVYRGDSLVDDDSTTHGELEPSARIYGGMTSAEVDAIAGFVARGGNVVAEFNTLEEPTSGTAGGDRLGALLGVRYDRWLGRWYGNLGGADEIPRWMRERYERTYWRPWTFRGPGLVFFSELGDRIVVIDSSEFTSEWPVTLEVTDAADVLSRRIVGGQPYWYWMSGVTPTDSGRVLARFELHVTDAAKRRMRQLGFAPEMPAVVRHRGAGLRAYLAGDFADVGATPPPLKRTRGLDWFGRLQARERRPGVQTRFWWRVTLPIWDGMLDEVRRQAR
jgi:hypothetical protein